MAKKMEKLKELPSKEEMEVIQNVVDHVALKIRDKTKAGNTLGSPLTYVGDLDDLKQEYRAFALRKYQQWNGPKQRNFRDVGNGGYTKGTKSLRLYIRQALYNYSSTLVNMGKMEKRAVNFREMNLVRIDMTQALGDSPSALPMVQIPDREEIFTEDFSEIEDALKSIGLKGRLLKVAIYISRFGLSKGSKAQQDKTYRETAEDLEMSPEELKRCLLLLKGYPKLRELLENQL